MEVATINETSANTPPGRDMLNAFTNALRRVARTKTFEQISVREIVQEAGYSSRTFYNHFRSKYDLVFWNYAATDYAYLEEAGADSAGISFPESLLRGLERLEADRALFQGAFRDWIGPESLCMTLVRHGVAVIPGYIRRRHGAAAVSDEVTRLVRFYVEGVVSELALWIADAKPMSPEAFRDFLVEAMPAPLNKLLLENKPAKRKVNKS
ncbi:MAG: TetR family transcriptional regulator [Kiritimatiellae bacterium]|nr:TetR family transcriptional regulator [Kiritimatiellia bacterium]